ncbi:ankyrin repeat domain-containing protein [Pseudomonas sp. 5P_3.1_Bac2]|uniref:ankyrin repeat domain-containing protein n=1 Tax=Pseudomonas sp. 5P_3.1_Bac2 TaxID=2971617 RepID=UPI0021C6C4DE|nr:ankyrin repeat domain-containing protein [Pseudomonas sp. 5P_3.1_Bac2]MCU1718049.1 ankyrin repeat domain-containing protein [Pseudomonas sp. 5P_3.1_Bac2]
MTRVLPLMLLLLSVLAGPSMATESTQQTAQQEVAQQLRDYLLNAARTGDALIINEFIQAGYDLNTQNEKGYTALILAAYNGQAIAVEQLLKAGANPCTEDVRGNTALMGAIFKGELRIAKRLMQAECSANQANHSGQTPAMYAALFQRKEILEQLRAHGADMSAQDAMGNSVENLLKGEFSQVPQR